MCDCVAMFIAMGAAPIDSGCEEAVRGGLVCDVLTEPFGMPFEMCVRACGLSAFAASK